MKYSLIEKFILEVVDATLDEAKFNPKELASIKGFSDRIDYASTHGLIPLGEGTSRIVFLLDSKRVLKLARNKKGIAQNEAELDAITNPILKPIFAKIYDYSPDYSWLVSELVRPIKTRKEFKELTGVDFGDFGRAIQNAAYLNFDLDRVIDYLKGDEENNVLYAKKMELIQNSMFVKNVFLAMKEGKLLEGDLDWIGHWGKTVDQRAVLLDYGYTESVRSKYY